MSAQLLKINNQVCNSVNGEKVRSVQGNSVMCGVDPNYIQIGDVVLINKAPFTQSGTEITIN